MPMSIDIGFFVLVKGEGGHDVRSICVMAI